MNSFRAAGEFDFIQPYEPSTSRFWESRKSARRPRELLWAHAGQHLVLEYTATVNRGVAELSVSSLFGSGGWTRFDTKIPESGQRRLIVPIRATGPHQIKLTSDLGAFRGRVRLRYELQ